MSTILAILALVTFLFALPFLFIDMTKSANNMIAKQKKLDALKEELEAADDAGNYSRAEDLKDKLEDATIGAVGNLILMVGSCFFYLMAGLGQLALETIVIVTALTTKVGDPLYGYIALGVMVALNLYAIIVTPKIVKKQRAQAEALGNTYVSKTNWFSKILGFIPDLYALYVFLVLIGVITSTAL